MDLSKILTITGKPGLYKQIAQAKNGVVVESITDQKRFQAFGNEKISSLEEISVFTTGEDKPLKDIFKIIFEKQNGQPSIDVKSSNDVLKKYFEEIVPDYDKDRVYVSHIRKIISWYNLLQQENLLNFSDTTQTDTGDASASPNIEPEK